MVSFSIKMVKLVLPISIILIFSVALLSKAAAKKTNIVDGAIDYLYKDIENAPTNLLTEPENKNDSIKYALFTGSEPKEACFLEPTPEEFNVCSFNSSCETKLLIHGYIEILQPGNLLEEMKDVLLSQNNYNIILVNWTLYNNAPLVKAIDNSLKVGEKVAEMVHFMMNHTGVNPQQFHCIGHSLGAHVCGYTARLVSNFSRVTGLDPGGITEFKLLYPNVLLQPTDADFVDVIHASYIKTGRGFGLIQPVGDMDFYVNGGILQKHCVIGNEYRAFKGEVLEILTDLGKGPCNHFIVIDYFTNSIRPDCEFPARKCKNLKSALKNLCPSNSSVTAQMGFYSKKVAGISPRSVFYVDIREFAPYCVNKN